METMTVPYPVPYERVRSVLASESGPLIVPAPVTAEIDYLVGSRHGVVARRRFLADLASGRFTVGCLEREDLAAFTILPADDIDGADS